MSDQDDNQKRGISRREVLKRSGMGLGALALGSVMEGPGNLWAAAPFVKGADISWLPQMEAAGLTFFNNSGVQQDCLTILKGFGINAARLRTWVNPSNDPSNGHCSQPETIAMAKRCKNAGLMVDIDFHFGDTWNSVGVQNPPAAWASLTFTQMVSVMQSYVHGFMTALRAAGVTPDWVQIGNEINSGICHPVGSLAHQPAQMTGLLNAAHDMVKQVFPSTPVLIHLAQPQNFTSVQNFLNAYQANGGQWDITAFSSYAGGSNVPVVLTNMKTAQSQWGRPVMQVEFGGKVTSPGSTQRDLRAFVTGVQGFGGLGVFYWEPEVYAAFNSYGSGAWDSTTRQPTAALQGFL